MSMIYIGIDPDVEKNGVAMLNVETRKLYIHQLGFADTIDYCVTLYNVVKEKASVLGTGFKVIIEAGWMNRGNWHLRRWDGRNGAAAKGVDQGRNEQTSRLIGEMMEHYSVPYEFKRPLVKCWAGHDRKITKEELESITGQALGRNNQEGRDAALLAWDKAGLPMRISTDTLRAITAKKQKRAAKVLKFPQND